MTSWQRNRPVSIVLIVAFALVAVALLSGCGSKAKTPAAGGATALGNLAVAQSALSTSAPDAKLLVVQTAQAVTSTATPVWAYLFGSPKSDKTYVVYISNGKTMSSAEYGNAGLTADDWAKVPGLDVWKTDSDAAYKSALGVSGAKGDPNAYMMGFVTYKPKTDTSTIEPFTWVVSFDPGKSGATTKTIEVNAETGVAKVSK